MGGWEGGGGRASGAGHLMVASYQVHILGVLYLERQQQADGLQGVGSPVHIVPQEQVVDVGDVPGSGGGPVLLKQAHQVPKLPMQVPKQLDRRCRRQGPTVWVGQHW